MRQSSTVRILVRPPARDGLELRCPTCGYGVVVRTAPERCPMCGSSSWEQAPRRGRMAPRPVQPV